MSYNDDFIRGVLIGALRGRFAAHRGRVQDRQQFRQQKQDYRQQGRLAALLDRYGVNVPMGGPPALAQLPGGGLAPVAQGAVAQGKVFPLGQTTITAGAAGSFAGSLEVRAERGFRPTRLMLFTNAASGTLVVSDINISTARQAANLEVMPVEAFSDVATAAAVDFDIIEPGTLASVDLIWTATGAGSISVSGVYYGTML